MADRNLVIKHRGGIYTTGEGMELHVPPSGFDWRAVMGGSPGVIDPYAESVFQQFPLGSKLVYGEEIYRYCQNGGVALKVSNLTQALVPLAGHINEAIGEPSVGDTTIAFTPNTATTDDLALNELQDGYIIIYDNTGEGHKYKILSNPVIVGAVSGVLTLVDPIRVAPVAASVATVIHNRFKSVIVHPAPITAIPAGFVQNIVTASYFFWVLTQGPTGFLVDGSLVLGEHVRPSEDDDGAVTNMDFNEGTTTLPNDGIVGRVMDIGADATGSQGTFGFGLAMLEA